MSIAIGDANSPVFLTNVIGGGVNPPNAPTNLVAVVNGLDIDLTWTDNATDEDGYKIYRSSDNIIFAEIDDIAAGSTAYTDLNPGSGVWYYYVAAYNAGGESDSNVASVDSRWWLSGGASGAVGAYQPKGAASLAASYINLANPGTNDAAPGVEPTLVAGGWLFNSEWLNTGLIPQNGWAMLVQFSDFTGGTCLAGSVTTVTTRFVLIPSSAGNVSYRQGGILNVSPAMTGGTVGFSGQKGYRNGVADAGTIPSWSGTATNAIAIGARKAAVPDSFISATIQAIAIYNNTLTADQVAAVSAAMAAL